MLSTILDNFRLISDIPRESWNEEWVRIFLENWADSNDYKYKTDSVWNIVIYVPATEDKSHSETIVLQWHMDMVCVKKSDSNHDFLKDPIEYEEKDGHIVANGTTLWADNGIGMAIMLSSIHLDSHPTLELFFTVDEEAWMTWAKWFDPWMILWRKLINIDSSRLGEVCISSAWWAEIKASKKMNRIPAKFPNHLLKIEWLKWWHSWVQIHKNLGNAIIMMLEFLKWCESKIEVISIDWGVAENAIPDNISIKLWIENLEIFEKQLSDYLMIYEQSHDTDKIKFTIEKLWTSQESFSDFISFLSVLNIKDWVHVMSPDIEGFVQTSINLWIITTDSDVISIKSLARSFDQEELNSLVKTIEENYKNNWFQYESKMVFPPWKWDPNWELVQKMHTSYRKFFHDTELGGVHAWVECWVIVWKIWDNSEAVCIWPNLLNTHTFNEKMELKSVEIIWKVVEDILKKF